MINIPSTIEDPAYRYKMPKMELKQESRLNGVKTNIFNLSDVAEALRVPDDFIIKYMCAELGVGKEKKSIIKGSHSYEIMVEVLDSFITKFILCPKCNLPEISLFAEKKILKGGCRACGKVSKLDNTHKISNHILRNIPKDMSEIDVKLKVGDDDEKKKGKKGKKGKKSKKGKKDKDLEEEKEEAKEEVDEEEELTMDSEEVKETIESISDIFVEKGDDMSVEDRKEEIRNQCVSIAVERDLKYYVALNSVLCKIQQEGEDQKAKNVYMNKILLTFQKNAPVFTSMVEEDGEEGTKCFIMAMVNFFIAQRPELESAITGFCKIAYDSNIVSEEVFLAWGDKKFKTNKKSSVYDKKAEKKFRKGAQKFLTWLQEAEEDEGEESEEEEEEKEELTEEEKKAKKMEQLIKEEKLKQEQALAESKAKADEEEKEQEDEGQKIDLMAGKQEACEEDDFDIDDI